jgi:hypothetical protein
MNETVSRNQRAGLRADAAPGVPTGHVSRPGRSRWLAAGAVVVLAAGGVAAAWRAGAFSPAASSDGRTGTLAPTTQAVTRQDLSATMPVTGTLGFAGSWMVRGQGVGTLTWLPNAGMVIRQGQVLYKVDNGSPVVLLYGRVPAWRTLNEGLTGADVSQLNHDLVKLGDASRSEIAALGWDYFSWETRAGVAKLQTDLGISIPPGWLGLGQVVFERGALRVKTVTASLGSPASGPVLQATSDRHQVTIALDASEQSYVKAGDKVTVTLPDGSTTAGVVSGIGTVATSSSSPAGYSSSSSSATIPVYVKLTRLKAAGSLDQAPVTVNITTDTVRNVLAVPVTALLARARGGYAVEVTGPRNTRRLVPVRVGPVFDDASGLVQVSGAGLAAGQLVVVPGS